MTAAIFLPGATVLMTTAAAAPDAPTPAAFNPAIAALVNDVSVARMYDMIYRLQNFTSRYVYNYPNITWAEENISAWMAAETNLTVQFQNFVLPGGPARNVIAVLPGLNPRNRTVYVVGGHHDSIQYSGFTCISCSDPDAPAPGADDDGSGTAAVIELARVMGRYRFNATLIFATWTGEERGLLGSEQYAAWARSQGMEIGGMLQLDMIANNPNPPLDIDVIYNIPSQPLMDAIVQANTDYGLGLAVNPNLDPTPNSDHASFWAQGYPAVFIAESEFSPNWHRPTDTIDQLNFTLQTRTTQVAAAALAEWAGIFPPNNGILFLDRTRYRSDGAVNVTLYDTDLNADGGSAETVQVNATSTTEPGGEVVTLTETGAATGVFFGSVSLTGGPPVGGLLEVVEGDTITVTYAEASPPGDRTATAVVDDTPPAVRDVAVIPGVTNATFLWTTDEPATTDVLYDTAAPPATVVSVLGRVLQHRAEVDGLLPGTPYVFDIRSVDEAGNVVLDDFGGVHRIFETMTGIVVQPAFRFADSIRDGDNLKGSQLGADILVGRSQATTRTYRGVVQLDTTIATFPPGATPTEATLNLHGLEWSQNNGPGQWTASLVDASLDPDWRSATYAQVVAATSEALLSPTLTNADLVPGSWNRFLFDEVDLVLLPSRIASGTATFRLDGPTVQGILFEWSDGYQSGNPTPTRPRFTVTYSETGDIVGPITSGVWVEPNPNGGATSVALAANVSDATTGGTHVNYAEWFAETDPGEGLGNPMVATDGGFDEVDEGAAWTVDVSAWATGLYTLSVRGRDQANNWGPAASVTFQVGATDLVPPVIEDLRAVPSPQQAGGTVNVSALLRDFNGVASASLNVTPPAGGAFSATLFYDPSTYRYYFDVPYFLPGTYTARVWVVDTQGNWATAAVPFQIIDTLPPSLTVWADPDPSEIPAAVTLWADVTDNSGVAIVNVSVTDPAAVSRGTFPMMPAGGSLWNLAWVPDALGTWSFVVTVEDLAGNVVTAGGTFAVQDTTPPSVLATATPLAQEVYGTVNVTAAVSENFGVASVFLNLTRPSGSWTNASMAFDAGGSTYYAAAAYAELGPYTAVVWVIDAAGHTGFDTATFSIADTTPPSITGLMVTPPSQSIGLPVNVSAVVADNLALAAIRLDVPGFGNVSMAYDAGSGRYYLERSYSVLETLPFILYAADSVGNANAVGGNITMYDAEVPVIGGVTTDPPLPEAAVPVTFRTVIVDNGAVGSAWLLIYDGAGNLVANLTLMPSAGNYSATTTLAAGSYNTTVWASDTAGNAARRDGLFDVFDTVPPLVTIVSITPTPPQEVPVTFLVAADASDPSGVASVTLGAVGLGTFSMAWNATSGHYEAFVAVTAPGVYPFTVRAWDADGNEGTASDQLEGVDTTPPSVAASAVPASLRLGTAVNLTAAVSDNHWIANVEAVVRDGGNNIVAVLPLAVALPGSYYVLLVLAAPDSYTFTVNASDASGNVGSDSGAFVVFDDTEPAVTATAAPAVQEPYEPVTIAATVSDDHRVDSVTVHIEVNAIPVGDFPMTFDGTRYVHTAPFDLLGVHTFLVTARDPSGNQNTSSGSFEVRDQTLPQLAGVQRTPTDPVSLADVRVSLLAVDNYLLQSVVLEVTLPPASTPYLTIPMSRVGGTDRWAGTAIGLRPAAVYTYQVVATDSSGNVAMTSGAFSVADRTPPAIRSVGTTPAILVLKEGSLGWADVVDDGTIARISLRVLDPMGRELGNHTMSFNATTQRFEFNRSYALLGTWRLEVWAVDASGNAAVALLLLAVTPGTPPTARAGPDVFLEAGEEAAFNGSLSTDDVGIVSYQWRLTVNGQQQFLGGSTARFAFIQPGRYEVVLVVEDEEGNEAVDGLMVTVDRAAPAPPGAESWWWLIALLLSVVAALLIVEGYRQQHDEREAMKPTEPETPPESPQGEEEKGGDLEPGHPP